jgi:DNA-binding response OmpR family regulator
VAAVASVLVVEDDQHIREALARELAQSGHAVRTVASGAGALTTAMEWKPDVVVLDLGLPDLDGVEVCRRLRDVVPGAPVLILTARTSEADVVVGLDAGADDYVTKPFRLAELLARLRALLRRAGEAGRTTHRTVAAQDVRVDVDARRAWVGDSELDLTPKEFDLLALLVSEAGTVVDRKRIMREVWDTTWLGATKTLDMHVSWLRRKLGDDANAPRYITTVRGVGFRFDAGPG